MLKRLAAAAALLVIPFAPISPASAGPIAAQDVDAPEEFAEAVAEAPTGDTGAFGYSLGVDPRTWQFSNSFMFRHSPWGDWSEAILGVTGRSQVIEPNGQYAMESSGLNASLGAKLWFLRVGVSTELDWVRKIEVGGGRLNWGNSLGFLIEPYIGTTLPFLETPFTSLDLRVYVPVTTFAPTLTYLSPDGAFGPRLVLTLWAGIPNSPSDEEEMPEESEPEESPDEPENMN